MHTTESERTYSSTEKPAPRLWVNHNSDFSGVAIVGWRLSESADSSLWRIEGAQLLTGDIGGPLVDDRGFLVPAWVVGRAVATAVRYSLLSKLTHLVEQL